MKNDRKYEKCFAPFKWDVDAEGMTPEQAERLGVDPPLKVSARHNPMLKMNFEQFLFSSDQSISSMKPGGHSWQAGERPDGMTYGRRPHGLFPDDPYDVMAMSSLLDASPMYHTFDEYYLITGIEPFHRSEKLPGTVEIWLGCGEQAECYEIDEPTCVMIPAGLVHGPTVFKNLTAPIMFTVVMDNPIQTNQHVRILPPEFVLPMSATDQNTQELNEKTGSVSDVRPADMM